MSRPRKSLEYRFAEKVKKVGECLEWTSAIGGSLGYGVFWIGNGRSEYAHRVAYMLSRGEIPSGMAVMHTCDNPRCVNPSHLQLGTAAMNNLDAGRKGRKPYGEANPGGGKLSDSAVRRIKLVKGLLGSTVVSRIFGVSTQTIKAIWRGRIWARTPPHLREALAIRGRYEQMRMESQRA